MMRREARSGYAGAEPQLGVADLPGARARVPDAGGPGSPGCPGDVAAGAGAGSATRWRTVTAGPAARGVHGGRPAMGHRGRSGLRGTADRGSLALRRGGARKSVV